MTAKAVLWTYKPRKNGSCVIKIYTHHNGKKTYSATSFSAFPDQWDSDKGRMKKGHPLAAKINAILGKLENEAMGKMVGVNNSLLQLIEQTLEDCRAGLAHYRPRSWKQWETHYRHLKAYCLEYGLDDLKFADIDMIFYSQFCRYLRKSGCADPGIGKHIAHLKRFMNIGLERGLHDNATFRSRAFHVSKKRVKKKIFLTAEEINALVELDLSVTPWLQKELDRFLVSYFMVMRYGDSIRISRDNIFEHNGTTYYKNIAEKTGVDSIVPVKPVALEIIQRNNYDLSGGTNQESNRKLKLIASSAGINTLVEAGEGKKLPKSMLVTTHTARRSAATNLLLSGVPLSEIMQIGGWKSESTLKHYLLAGGIRLAELSAGREFFR